MSFCLRVLGLLLSVITGQCLQGQCKYGKPSMPDATDRTAAHVAVAMLNSGVLEKGALCREHVLSQVSFLSRGIS